MIDNGPEVRAKSVVEIASNSSNERMREFAMRIIVLKEAAESRVVNGAIKLFIGLPASITAISAGAYINFATQANTPERIGSLIIMLGGSFGVGVLLPSVAKDINAAALARGEINSLTTALASHIIAEGIDSGTV